MREDYSSHGTAWESFPHDHARSRAYRWNEDGLAGICDRHQLICFAVALWNGHDRILKERVFGLTGNEGNHGEDVKESYFYLDSTPTHSYMKYLYKYPQAAFPYRRLVEENRRRGRHDPEFELMDSGVFDENRYFDVFVEYAKATPEDLCIRIQVVNRGPEQAELTLLPTLWYRNTWSWGSDIRRPRLRQGEPMNQMSVIETQHEYYGLRRLLCDGEPTLLFTENDTNSRRLYSDPEGVRYVKDSFHDYVVQGQKDAVNPDHVVTKAAAQYVLTLAPGDTKTFKLRFTNGEESSGFATQDFDAVFTTRVSRRRTSSMTALRRAICRKMRAECSGKPLLDCSGANSFITMRSIDGSRAIRACRSRRVSVSMAATRTGRTSITPMSSRCRTSGSTPGMPHGISPFTASRLRSSTRHLPRISSS